MLEEGETASGASLVLAEETSEAAVKSALAQRRLPAGPPAQPSVLRLACSATKLPGPTLAGLHPCWGCPPFLLASWPPLGSLPLPPTPQHPSPISLATATHLPGFEEHLL